MSRKDFSAAVGVVDSTVQKWEAQGFPGAEQLVELRRVTGLSLDYLLGAID